MYPGAVRWAGVTTSTGGGFKSGREWKCRYGASAWFPAELPLQAAAVVTPTPDMVTQTALALPMIGLYALGIGISYVFGKKVT